jgi:hypothetical protein
MVPWFELRASGLLGWHSTAEPHLQSHYFKFNLFFFAQGMVGGYLGFEKGLTLARQVLYLLNHLTLAIKH